MGKCYKIFSENLDYFGAKSACKNLGTGADLAAPKTEAIQNVLNNLWTALGDEEADTWLGLDDCGSATSPCDDSADGTFTFSDGSSLAVSSGSFETKMLNGRAMTTLSPANQWPTLKRDRSKIASRL